jgi:hypothetical protein
MRQFDPPRASSSPRRKPGASLATNKEVFFGEQVRNSGGASREEAET